MSISWMLWENTYAEWSKNNRGALAEVFAMSFKSSLFYDKREYKILKKIKLQRTASNIFEHFYKTET